MCHQMDTRGSRSLSPWWCGGCWVPPFPPGERHNYKKEERKAVWSTYTDQRRDRHCKQQLLVKWPHWGCSCLYLMDQKDCDQKGTMEKMPMEGHHFAGKTGTSFRCRKLPHVQEHRSPPVALPSGSLHGEARPAACPSCLWLCCCLLLQGPCAPINIEQGKGTKGLKPLQQQELRWIKAWKMFSLRSELTRNTSTDKEAVKSVWVNKAGIKLTTIRTLSLFFSSGPVVYLCFPACSLLLTCQLKRICSQSHESFFSEHSLKCSDFRWSQGFAFRVQAPQGRDNVKSV